MGHTNSPIHRFRETVLEAWAVLIAADMALFDDLVEPVGDEALALRRGWDRSATRALLDALCATGYVHRDGSRYWVDANAGHLATRAPDFIGPSFGFLRVSHHFARYAQVLVEGGAAPLTERDWGHIVQGSAAYTEPAVAALFALVAGLEDQALTVLDCGCGAGTYSESMIRRNPSLDIVAIDPTASVAKLAAERLRGTSVDVRCADVHAIAERFDLVVLNHVLHAVGAEESVSLLKKLRERVKPGGHLLIQELVDTGVNRGALFGFLMRLIFPAGTVFALDQLASLTETAGFEQTEVRHIGPPERGLVYLSCTLRNNVETE